MRSPFGILNVAKAPARNALPEHKARVSAEKFHSSASASKMSLSATPEDGTPLPLPSPKRKRSESPNGYGAALYDGPADDADLQYAYEDPPSELQTPDNDEENVTPKKRRLERPRRLKYVPHMTLRGHKRPVASVKFSPDGHWIASCSADATIKIWKASSGVLHKTLEGHLAGVSCISWAPDSAVLASGSDDKLIRLWDVATGKPFPQPLQGHHNYVYSLAFSPKGNMLVSGSYDEAVFLWDIRTARLMRSLPAHSDPVRSVDFVRDGTLVVSCSSDGLIRIWDTGTGQCLKTLVHEDNAPVTSVRFSPNGKYVLAATLDSSVRLWDYVDGRVVKTYHGHKNVKYSINPCFGTYGPDTAHLAEADMADIDGLDQKWAFVACGSENGSTHLWDVSSKEVLQILHNDHDGVVLGVDINHDHQAIATCGLDKTVKIWKRVPLPPGEDADGDGEAVNGAVDEALAATAELNSGTTAAVAIETTALTPMEE